MAIFHQLAVSLLLTSSVWAQHEDFPRNLYDARRLADQGGMQYYYVPQNMFFNGRQQEMTYSQDPFFGFDGEHTIPFSQDIFKPIPARKPQSSGSEGVNPAPYADRNPVPDSDQAPFYIIPTEVELPEQAVPVPISPPSSSESVESSSNATEAPADSAIPAEDRNGTSTELPVTGPPVGSTINLRKAPLRVRPYFTNAHHYPFPMGMKDEYKLQYQAIFPDAPLPEQESFIPSESFGGDLGKPTQFMWLNPYAKKPGNPAAEVTEYDPTMFFNIQQQQQPKPQLVYYYFNPQGGGMPQPQTVIPDMKPEQQQGFNNPPSSPVYMLFQPSDEESLNVGTKLDNPVGSISGRGGQAGQYVDVPLSFMSSSGPQQQNRFYYVRPDVNRYLNDRV